MLGGGVGFGGRHGGGSFPGCTGSQCPASHAEAPGHSPRSFGPKSARSCRHIPLVRPIGGPGGVRCVLSARRAQALVLVVRGSVPGAARVRAWRRQAGGNVTTGPRTVSSPPAS